MKAETKTITATVSGTVTVTQTASVTVTSAAAASLTLNAGSGQTATVGTGVATAPSVLVTDQFANPVAGVGVTFTAVSGGGTVSPTTPVTTNASGIAAVTSWTLGTTAGTNTLTASAPGLTGSPVTFTATGKAAAAAKIAIKDGNNQTAVMGTAVPIPPSVTVTDQYGNPVMGVSVTFVPSSGSSVSPSTVSTDASGVAAVTSWTLGLLPGSYTLVATAPGTGSGVTFTATAL
jgi:adhesin/invasin